MRLFIAIELPEEVRNHLAGLAKRLEAASTERWGLPAQHMSRISFTRRENLHVTVKFLGEVDERRVAEVCGALSDVSIGPAHPLVAERAELLPPRGPVRVIAVGLGGDVATLQRLYEEVDRRCASLGFASERRPYRAHITIARARNPLPNSLRGPAAETLGKVLPGTPFAATEFVLMHSQLQAGGPHYTRLATFPMR